jgi:P-aminobenzoate N-oxygenase AurF
MEAAAISQPLAWNARVFDRLTQLSVRGDYTPFGLFHWPERLPEDDWWMSPGLLSIHGTPLMDRLAEEQLKRLSKWESINFYSLNIHGIRELLIEVTRRLYARGFEIPSDFFHRFIGEENDHMWFFAQFCLRYGTKIYPSRLMPLRSQTDDAETEAFLVFARILIFEELVDHFNVRMANDDSLHPLIQQINRVHHKDESRHIAAGREVLRQLYRGLTRRLGIEQLQLLDEYLRHYLQTMIEALYNPLAYRDAGIAEAYRVRERLLADPSRRPYHEAFTRRTTRFLIGSNIISQGLFA